VRVCADAFRAPVQHWLTYAARSFAGRLGRNIHPRPQSTYWRGDCRGSATGPRSHRRRLTRSVRAASATVPPFSFSPPRARGRASAHRPLTADATGKSSWLPSPILDLSFGTKAPDAPRTDGEIVAQTSADCCVYATPGLVGCIAAADSIVTGKSFAEGLTAPFRQGCVSCKHLLELVGSSFRAHARSAGTSMPPLFSSAAFVCRCFTELESAGRGPVRRSVSCGAVGIASSGALP
jgi:hypothetical protein